VQQTERAQGGASHSKRIRVAAWVAIGVLTLFQAYAHRYAVGPDGISYLDLSDAIVTGDLSRLVNLYWSPLYPTIIGVARFVISVKPTAEIQIVHAVNFAMFVAMFAAFEYLLISIRELAKQTRNSILGGVAGEIGAYAIFGFTAFVMLPQELTTPDLVSGACMLGAFGALLRLQQGSKQEMRDAVVLGLCLGLGGLAKSFLVPWAIVCFVVLFLATRGRGLRSLAVSGALWFVVIAPWILVLSHSAGRFTFGDTGRLTYAWYVNGQSAPSGGGVPLGARTQVTEAILTGVGVTGPAPGTDPMWFDPARWNTMVKPYWNLHEQLATIYTLQIFYLQSLTPLVFFIFLIITAPRGSRRRIWWNGWVIFVPALAGIGAYALVLVTARYVMPFVLAGTLALLATIPRPRRMLPLLAMLGVAIPLGLEAASSETIIGMTVVASVIAGMTAAALIPDRYPAVWTLGFLGATIASRFILPPSAPDIARLGAFLVAIVFWFSARSAVRAQRTVLFAQRASIAMMVLMFAVLAIRWEARLKQDVAGLIRAGAPGWGNLSVKVADELARHGIGPGTRVAIIGPHAESYWARIGRLNIVADVPRTRTEDFWKLPIERREALLQEFAAAGATVAIASIGPAGGAPDSSWTPVNYKAWIRRLR
jgi:hypothetical protein